MTRTDARSYEFVEQPSLAGNGYRGQGRSRNSMLMNASDATRPSLLIAIRDSGNQAAWYEFVGLYTPLVYQHCVQRGLQGADAADVAQEVMKSVSGAIGRFDYDRRKGSFRAWLLTVTRSKLANFFGSRARRGVETGETAVLGLESSAASPAELADWDREYEKRLLHWAMDHVKGDFEETTWLAFWRTAVEERAVAEVASGLGISTGAVYIARSRVIARIRKRVGDVDVDDPMARSLFGDGDRESLPEAAAGR